MIMLSIEGGPGLYDPCEKDPSDVVGGLTKQQKEDITSSAQVRYTLTCQVTHYCRGRIDVLLNRMLVMLSVMSRQVSIEKSSAIKSFRCVLLF